jgi:FtsH-binding integral membrane protein
MDPGLLSGYGRVGGGARVDESASREFLTRVYGFMSAGLGITALTALAMASSPALMGIFFGNPLLLWGSVIAQLVLVFTFSARVNKMAVSNAAIMLVVYAVLNGVIFSSLFLRYTGTSIFGTFVVTSGMFAGMSAYGSITKKDLASWGSFGMMGVIGIILASIVNLFIGSSMVSFVISVCGVVAFVALTAYDTQKIRDTFSSDAHQDDQTRLALGGALTLYLDFVNLFIFMLRLFGGRRD